MTVHVEVVDLLQGHTSTLLSFLVWMGIVRLAVGCVVVIGASLAVGALLLDDELLARVRIDLVDLWQLLLLLSLQLLGLLLLVLLQPFFALVAGQFAVIGALGHALGLRGAGAIVVTGALGGDGVGPRVPLSLPLALRVRRSIPQVCWLDLTID